MFSGILSCLDGYMNIALEQTEEHVNGAVTNRYGDAFIRGNNGMSITPHGWSPCSNFYSIHSPVHLGLRSPMILQVPDHSLWGTHHQSRLCADSQSVLGCNLLLLTRGLWMHTTCITAEDHGDVDVYASRLLDLVVAYTSLLLVRSFPSV